jgi:hypothetical protein
MIWNTRRSIFECFGLGEAFGEIVGFGLILPMAECFAPTVGGVREDRFAWINIVGVGRGKVNRYGI